MSKTILITGSTDGIGKLAAISLAKAGHQVFLHGRKPDKLSKVIEEVKASSDNSGVDGFVADFSDLNAVREMAAEVRKKIPTLDVLVNNAGVYKAPNPEKGLDVRIVVNYLAPYILTNELLPAIKSSSEARIINLSSAAQASISPEVLKGNRRVSEDEAYAQSKLAILMWSFDLASREKDLSVIALNPGSLLNTNMVREAFGRFWSSADKGAEIIYELATSEAHKGISGKYFDNDKGDYGKAHVDAYAEEAISRLITTTESLI